ncbi:MAG: dehydratase [Candidatus Marinimicrobia bacterium]|nr:dehydratase [Candidatus Neomarinimicrobiota bacterium]|tara:strand:- start:4150 stop:4569 length:420 start_codon:yes stop_codon:yes gene_type:complete
MESWNIKKINIGDKLPKLITEPLTRDILKLYSIASGDHNPIHLDTNYAKGVGLPNIIAHGMLIMSYLTRLITNNIEQASIKEVGVKFTSMTNIGDTLTCLGEVEELTKENDMNSCKINLKVLNQDKDIKLSGYSIINIL